MQFNLTTPPPFHFADRLIEQAKKFDSRLIVGLDPDLTQFPAALHHSTHPIMTENQLEDAIVQFNQIIIEATCDCTVAYKPQVAFYEQYGIAGMRALQRTLECLRSRNLISILDAKRNDISHTAEAYAKAWLSPLRSFPPSPNPWQADAMTINGYLGKDGVLPFLEANRDAGLFVLVKTSNSSSSDLQDVPLADGQTVYAKMAHLTHLWGQTEVGASGYSRVGLVVGATYPEAAKQLRSVAPQAIFLMPGIGAQAGSLDSITVGAGPDKLGAYAAVSRGILYHYKPEDIDGDHWVEKLKNNVSEQANRLKEAIQQALRETRACDIKVGKLD
jgi:orotidine-5'-phosphate decarboxylase